MELIKVSYKAMEAEGKKCEGTGYALGENYYVEKRVTTYADGQEYVRIYVNEYGEYTPKIYYEDDFYGKKMPRFEIQTCAYGALNPEEIKKVISGYQMAIEAVEILTKEFC